MGMPTSQFREGPRSAEMKRNTAKSGDRYAEVDHIVQDQGNRERGFVKREPFDQSAPFEIKASTRTPIQNLKATAMGKVLKE